MNDNIFMLLIVGLVALVVFWKPKKFVYRDISNMTNDELDAYSKELNTH